MKHTWPSSIALCLWLLAPVAGCSDDETGGGAANDVQGDASTESDRGRDLGGADSGGEDGTTDAAGDVGAGDATAEIGDDSGPTDTASDTVAADTADAPDNGPDAADSGADTADAPDQALADSADTADTADTGGARSNLLPGFCPPSGSDTAPGLYEGTLASNTNDIADGCTGASPGRDGAVRIELEPGQTVTAHYRHDGDGILYILDSCPVTASCLDGSDTSSSGQESVSWTNDGGVANPIFVVLDSDSLGAPQTFELDLFVE